MIDVHSHIVFDVDDYYGDGFSPGVSGVWDLKMGRKEKKYMDKAYLVREVKSFLMDEDGVGVIELVLILVEIFIPYYQVCIRCIK